MHVEPAEAELLTSLRAGLYAALEGADPGDAVVARLFPPAVVGDETADADLRALLHDDLLQSRLAGLDALTAILDRAEPHRGRLRVDLVDDEPLLVLGVVNDIRLAIGARVGPEAMEAREALPADDPLQARMAIMDHFAWWQEQLLAILDPPSVSHYEAR